MGRSCFADHERIPLQRLFRSCRGGVRFVVLSSIILFNIQLVCAQWYTNVSNPPRAFPNTDLGALIPDSTGGAYFFSVFGLADPNVMHVQINGVWDHAYPGTYLGGRGSLYATNSIVDSENNFVVDIIYSWIDIGGPHLPNHLVKVNTDGQFLWDYALPDTNTIIRTMVPGLDGQVLINHQIRVQDDDTTWLYRYPQYLQIFNLFGEPEFAWDEKLLNADGGWRIFLSDGEGGAIYAWLSDNDGESYELRLQQIDTAGNFIYPSDGLLIPVPGLEPGIADASPNGFFVFYYDSLEDREGVSRVNFDGEVEWNVLKPDTFSSYSYAYRPDRYGGAFLTGREDISDSTFFSRVSRQGEYLQITKINYWSTQFAVSSTSGLNALWFHSQDSAWVLQRYDTLGQAQWPEPIIVFNFPPADWIEYAIISCDEAGGTMLGFYRRWGYPEQRGWYFTRVDAEGNIGSSVYVPDPLVPSQFRIAAYPNPFNSSISFEWNEGIVRNIELRIFNTLGQEIRQWAFNNPSKTRLLWDGRDSDGTILPSGKYFARIITDANAVTLPIILLK